MCIPAPAQASCSTHGCCPPSPPWACRYNNVISVAWNCYVSWTCVGGGGFGGGLDGGGLGGSGPSAGEEWLASLPCVRKLQAQLGEGGGGGGAAAAAAGGLAALAPLDLLTEARHAGIMERILGAWGWQVGKEWCSLHLLCLNSK